MTDSSRGMHRGIVSALLLLFVVPCCSGAASEARQTPAPNAKSASGSTTPEAGNTSGDYCTTFTREQIGAALGKPVKPGRVPELATDGCQWDATDAKGTVFIQRYFAGLWNDLSTGAGQRSVQGIGEKAYIGPSPLGGVQAGAVAGDSFYLVRIDPAPADDAVTGLLRTFVTRSAH